jgi:small subunit ribosomal protein S21
MQVFVRDNNVDQALRILKKKMQREGIFREIKKRSAYEKPSERKSREKAEAIRRIRKLARKKAQREGLLPAPKPKEKVARPRDISGHLSLAKPMRPQVRPASRQLKHLTNITANQVDRGKTVRLNALDWVSLI